MPFVDGLLYNNHISYYYYYYRHHHHHHMNNIIARVTDLLQFDFLKPLCGSYCDLAALAE